ncbi:MAG: VWA domain-containing protein [Vicinamibacteria bacterium]|nr:VWA domain-containing protein [Vicinamibacteria bacterium]
MLELILAAGLVPALHQEPKLEFRSDVGLIRLDVSVVDRRGQSVAGLEQHHFRVLEDGRPVALTYFEAFHLEAPDSGTVGAGAPAARRTLILVDSARMTHFQLVRARASLASFFGGGTVEGDAIHLVNLSTDGTWSGVVPHDRGRLVAAARSLSRRASPWEVASDDDRIVDVQESPGQGGAPSETLTSGRFLSEFAQSRDLLATLESYLVALGGVTGRKALVLVSPGFPTLRNLEARLERVATLARESATAIYFLDSVGLDGLTPEPGRRLQPAFEGAWLRSGGAQDLAAYTGGFTARFANSLAPALGRVGQELRTYYVIGYVPSRTADGRFREVKVRVEVPGLRARTKKGYVAGLRSFATRP